MPVDDRVLLGVRRHRRGPGDAAVISCTATSWRDKHEEPWRPGHKPTQADPCAHVASVTGNAFVLQARYRNTSVFELPSPLSGFVGHESAILSTHVSARHLV